MRDEAPLLAGSPFDRAAERRKDEAWLSDAWTTARVLVISPKSATPATRGGDAPRLAFRGAADVPHTAPRRFLGIADGVVHFTATIEPDDDGDWLTLRELGLHLDDLEAGLLATAIALEQWHQRHEHCPVCGAPTVETAAGWTRTCPNDGTDHFPRTDPAVILLVTVRDDRALLGRGHDWGAGRFSTLAGFVEPGESLEAALAREVFEEVGVRIRDIRYVGSQPWPFPSSLMLGFSARVDGDTSITLDPVEMAEAGWFTRDEVRRAAHWADTGATADEGARIVAVSPKLSISRYLIDRWLAGELPA
jgi:NAD+ diphosphatase